MYKRQDRPNAKLDPDVLLGQIKSFETFMITPATEGKPIGYQAPSDWEAAIATLKKVEVLKEGFPAADFFTNDVFDSSVYEKVAAN